MLLQEKVLKNQLVVGLPKVSFAKNEWPSSFCLYQSGHWLTCGLLICTLIAENQGLEKLRSVSDLRQISGPAHLIFFFSLSPGFFSGLWHKSSFFFSWRPKKKLRFAGPEIFLRFAADLDFSRLWLSEIKVQI